MKKLLLFTACVILILPVKSQWCEQVSGVSSSLDEIFFCDSLNGWAHSTSALLHTGDGGLNWHILNGPENTSITGIFFTGPENGWMAGDSSGLGRLYRSADSGNTWHNADIGCPYVTYLGDIYFLDPLKGWIIGYYSDGTTGEEDTTYVFRTSDGGLSWQKSITAQNIFNTIFFTDTLNGWLGGYYDEIYHTEDGGVTWALQETPDLSDWYQVTDICFTDNSHGWAAGRHFPWGPGGVILKYGPSAGWELLSGANSYGGVYFADTLEGWVSTSGIQHTLDGGYTWEWELGPLPISYYLYSISFPFTGKGWACGESGVIYHTCYYTGITEPGTFQPDLYPNPASGRVTLDYFSKHGGKYTLEIFDLSGVLFDVLEDEFQSPGPNQIIRETVDFPAGIYLYRLTTDGRTVTGKFAVSR